MDDPALTDLISDISHYDKLSVLRCISSTLLIPASHGFTFRLEALAAIALQHCNGNKPADASTIIDWIINFIDDTSIRTHEDPVTDTFSGIAGDKSGSYAIFMGLWPSSDFHVDLFLKLLSSPDAPATVKGLYKHIIDLLLLSERLAASAGVTRYTQADSTDDSLTTSAVFIDSLSHAQLLDVAPDFLPKPVMSFFSFKDKDLNGLDIGETQDFISRKPLYHYKNNFLVLFPSAFSPSIREFTIAELHKMGELSRFLEAFRTIQMRYIFDIIPYSHYGISYLLSDTITSSEHFILDYHVYSLSGNTLFAPILLTPNARYIRLTNIGDTITIKDDNSSSISSLLEHIIYTYIDSGSHSNAHILLVVGGVGHGLYFSSNYSHDALYFTSISFFDLILMCSSDPYNIVKYIELDNILHLIEQNGPTILSPDGFFGIFCHWTEYSHRLFPSDAYWQSTTLMTTDLAACGMARISWRIRCDEHYNLLPGRGFLKVTRFRTEGYFDSRKDLTTYVSRDGISLGLPLGVSEYDKCLLWLSAKKPKKDPVIMDAVWNLWSNIMDLSQNIIRTYNRNRPTIHYSIAIYLDFSEVTAPLQSHSSSSLDQDHIYFKTEYTLDSATIILPTELLQYFRTPNNSAEIQLVSCVYECLDHLLHSSQNLTSYPTSLDLAHKVLGTGIRFIHAFTNIDPVAFIQHQYHKRPLLPAAHLLSQYSSGLWYGLVPDDSMTQIHGRSNSKTLLNKIVDKLAVRAVSLARETNRRLTLIALVEAVEAIMYDREHWIRTARALSADVGREEAESAANKRENERSMALVSIKAAIEISTIESPIINGNTPDHLFLENLTTQAALLINVASDSDAIHHGLCQPNISLYRNGSYSIDDSYKDNVVKPYYSNYYNKQYSNFIEDYTLLYNVDSSSDEEFENKLDDDYKSAIIAEYGLEIYDIIRYIRRLIEYGIENNMLVVQATNYELLTYLGISTSEWQQFMDVFSIQARKNWDTIPPNYEQRDIMPWRYDRRLSFTLRPILQVGRNNSDHVIYGLASLREGFVYRFSKIQEGQFSPDFFRSSKMRSYIGSAAHRRGNAFTYNIYDRFREAGWEAEAEVNMTQLGGASDHPPGDVDVICWKNDVILIVECKHLRFSRTISEIGEILRRFKGEATDELNKHLSRYNWIRSNPSCLTQFTNTTVDSESIKAVLVTSTDVPMQYIDSLPLSMDAIGTVDSIIAAHLPISH